VELPDFELLSAHCNLFWKFIVSWDWDKSVLQKVNIKIIRSLCSSLIRFFSLGATA
jgi:hypothetical protein